MTNKEEKAKAEQLFLICDRLHRLLRELDLKLESFGSRHVQEPSSHTSESGSKTLRIPTKTKPFRKRILHAPRITT